jgi:hypothetical protein
MLVSHHLSHPLLPLSNTRASVADMNERSSRSHCIFILTLQQIMVDGSRWGARNPQPRTTAAAINPCVGCEAKPPCPMASTPPCPISSLPMPHAFPCHVDSRTPVPLTPRHATVACAFPVPSTTSQLNLVDLAGSERVLRSGATGVALQVRTPPACTPLSTLLCGAPHPPPHPSYVTPSTVPSPLPALLATASSISHRLPPPPTPTVDVIHGCVPMPCRDCTCVCAGGPDDQPVPVCPRQLHPRPH